MNWDEIIRRIFELYDSPRKNKLAATLHLDKSMISKWTTDDPETKRHPTWDTLKKIVDEKGVTWDWLLEGREPKYRRSSRKRT